MKRSRKMLLRVLETAEDLGLEETSEHLSDDALFFYHAKLLCSEGYLVCDWQERSALVTIKRMTMKGHDFLDKLREENDSW